MFGDNFVVQCRLGCWGLSAFAGLVTMFLVWSEAGFLATLFLAVALTIFMALVLIQLFCWDDEEEEDEIAHTHADAAALAAAGAGAAPAAPAPSATGPVKSGTLLKGEQEVADSKGSWKYNKDGGSATEAAAGADSKANSAELFVSEDADAEAGAQVAPSTGEGEGTKPEGLSAPRGGKPDNLKEIKGVGPKLEKLLNEMGFYHFDQIAGWTSAEIAWVDENLVGFKGRVTRDDWVDQAKTLAAGGETEFSKRVDKGDVY